MATYSGTAGSETPSGTIADDVFRGSAGNDTISGGGGYNQLDYRNLGAAITVNISSSAYAGTVTKAGGGTDTYTDVQRIIGSGDNDTLVGTNDATAGLPYAVVLIGGVGDDQIDGRSTTLNLVSYSDATAGMTINLTTGVATGGTRGNDSLVNVRRVQGSSFNDVITGSAANDFFDASAGSDQYFGGGGYNTISYSAAQFTSPIVASVSSIGAGLFGFANITVIKSNTETDIVSGANQIIGTSSNDVLIGTSANYSWNNVGLRGGAGNDTINGQGSTTNRADYSSATSAAYVDLAAGTAADGQGGTDTLINVRGVIASDFNDTLLGSDANDVFSVGSSGQHFIDGRGGSNSVVFNGTEAVTIDLGTVLAPNSTGYAGAMTKAAGTDYFYNINGATGGAGNDTIYGTPTDDQLGGGQGSNLIDGRGGSDTYRAGSYAGVAPTTGATIDLGDGNLGFAINSWGGTDTLFSVENARGTQFADTMTGAVNGALVSYIRGDGGNDVLRAPTAGSAVTADYAGSLTGVVVHLNLNFTSDDGWFGGQDLLINIDRVRGSSNADAIVGNDAGNAIMGEDGNDVIYGLGAADFLDAGSGNDTVYGGLGDDSVFGGGGDDAILGEDGNDLLYGLDGRDVVNGGAGNDTLAGGAGDDIVAGVDGDDLVYGEDGNDVLYGQAGSDTLYGGAGDDVVRAGTESDTVVGDSGNDLLVGEDGNDILNGQDDNDTLLGGFGDDSLLGGNGADVVYGEDGRDILYGEAGSDILYGGAGDDVVRAGSENDIAVGEGGNDLLLGEDGNDILDGQDDSDTLLGGLGNDSLLGGSGTDVLYGEDGNDVLYGQSGNDTLVGGAGDDQLLGGNEDDSLYGQAGNDLISGEIGDDIVFGDTGNDTILGGIGNDSLNGEADGDSLFGEAGLDTLFGGVGNDYMRGGDGNDVLIGGEGNDEMFGDAGVDVFVFAPGFGADIIHDFSPHAAEGDLIQFQAGTFSSYAAVQAASQQVGANVVITFSATDMITLENVNLASLSSSDFVI